jgi:uncharacterized RDD family membrane protein YckC
MKCPKCQYITFDSGDRCRNCGYDFSLLQGAAPADSGADLPMQDGSEPVGPLADLSLHEAPALPLFTGDRRDPDAPLVAQGAPRAPLAVRRAAPAAPRPRPRREHVPPEPRLALDTADLGPPPADDRASDADDGRHVAEMPDGNRVETSTEDPTVRIGTATATAMARLAGGAVDLLLLGAIDLTVVYFTLRICDLTFGETLMLPAAPMMAFLLMLNGGYLATFVAASGQTIGKMAAGTRVVSADPGAGDHDRVSFEQAALRAVASVISTLPLGLGFLPALFGRERRALHDRLADTRVVKA